MISPTEMLLICLLALCWDKLFGELPNRCHPVVWMGWSIDRGAKLFLGRSPRVEWWGGLVLVISLSTLFTMATWWGLRLCQSSAWAEVLLGTFCFKSSFAWKGLGQAAEIVTVKLAKNDIEGARFELRSLCSRNANELNEAELTEASISSLAENLSDSIIAPWLFAIIFGLPGAIFYRVINTMDAMIGYKNHYIHLGYGAAKLDDFLNLIPARLSAFLILLSGMMLRKTRWGRDFASPRHSWQVTWRDHHKTPSPNGGWPMSAVAGVLGISLRKKGIYELGSRQRPSEFKLIGEAWRIVNCASCLGAVAMLMILIGSLFK